MQTCNSFTNLPYDIRLCIADHIHDWHDHEAFRCLDRGNYQLFTDREAVKQKFAIRPDIAKLIDSIRSRMYTGQNQEFYTFLFQTCRQSLKVRFPGAGSFSLEEEDPWSRFVHTKNFSFVLQRIALDRHIFPESVLNHSRISKANETRHLVVLHLGLLQGAHPARSILECYERALGPLLSHPRHSDQRCNDARCYACSSIAIVWRYYLDMRICKLLDSAYFVRYALTEKREEIEEKLELAMEWEACTLGWLRLWAYFSVRSTYVPGMVVI
ncbi:hypothetical protein BJ508DRAFT_379995 [Ascobolus immersus RN42]|uniref:Uncharacterized protein n=1 Tax=Ascobolus immersus RN42 TaxID=1160509 RepID=A0A3N4HU21_ASCIM|nr:hypothetical protein BJ508DRAFT_379995 [Ascobolus immersus RN42]